MSLTAILCAVKSATRSSATVSCQLARGESLPPSPWPLTPWAAPAFSRSMCSASAPKLSAINKSLMSTCIPASRHLATKSMARMESPPSKMKDLDQSSELWSMSRTCAAILPSARFDG
ncbi:hypothetical protein BDV25DRAFT_149052 [Aspergillus avenaceus]|uniref:Uncharacterized protein n=1 Tax=Aspergillus avenaceus TaxID=36643 RepID=A0A5N6U5P1_ASPAV|nr:hypothetical protein BDV25DRAFT_149052 [Aspergillus avenaceus]